MSTFHPKLKAIPGTIVKRIFLCRHGETEANATGMLQGSGTDLELNKIVYSYLSREYNKRNYFGIK
jgi:hypothetical protein